MTTHQVTVLLHRVRDGEPGASTSCCRTSTASCGGLRAFMKRQQPGHTLQPTALVNEAFIKLFHDVMRQVLVDHARGGEAGRCLGERILPLLPRRLVGGGCGCSLNV